jgi:hypothetical protein
MVSLMCDVGYDVSKQFETANGFTQRAHEDLINTCGFGIWAYLPGRIVTPRRREPTWVPAVLGSDSGTNSGSPKRLEIQAGL